MKHRRRGFLIADGVIAIAVVAMAGMMLATTLGHAGKANRSIADSRHARAVATETLLCLQTGIAPPGQDESLKIQIAPLPDAPDAPIGWRWVRVGTQYREKGRASVVGLVRSTP